MTERAGRVLQVSVSPGGVPKLPIKRAHVGRLGLDGDAHHDVTGHGGPHRAVCLFAIEAIRRVAADGHPVFPGSCGENLTTEGIELSRLPAGTRLAVGERVVLELSKPDNPCVTIAGSFVDGRFARISIKVHPDDSRMYARVLVEGDVRPGDPVRVMPAAPDSAATTHLLLDRVDALEQAANLARWRAAEEAGFAIEIVDDGELALAAARELPGPAFNRADGLRAVPNLLPRVLEHFRRAGTPGWLPMDERPWPGAEPDVRLDVHAADPQTVLARADEDAEHAAGLRVEPAGPVDLATWADIVASAGELGGAPADGWRRILPLLARAPAHHPVLARLDGAPVGAGLLVARKNAGLLRSASVLPTARGHGVQRALIAGRALIAAERGLDALIAITGPEAPASARNVERLGFERVWTRAVYRFDPGGTDLDEAAVPGR